MTFEKQLREWAAAGHGELTASVTVTDYGVVVGLGPARRYDARNFFVNGDVVAEMTEPVPPPPAKEAT